MARVPLPRGPSAPLLEIAHSRRDRELARRLAAVAVRFDPRVFPAIEESVLPPRAADEPSSPPAAFGVRDTVRILVAADEDTFQRASGGRLPDWGLAVAFPGEACIVLRSPRLVSGNAQDPGQVLVHELAHVYLALFLGPVDRRVPRWFHEGLASLLAGEWGWSERFELVLALLGGRPLPLEQLEGGFPSGREAAGLAYLESLTAVAYLRDLSGEEGLRVFLHNLRRLGDFDEALRRTYGVTYGEFEARWRTSLVRRYGWAAAAASSWTFWMPAALVLIVAVLLRRARTRSRLAELEREEREKPEREELEELEELEREEGGEPEEGERSPYGGP